MDREASDDPPLDGWTATQPAEERRILVILHQAHSVPGRIGVRLEQRGFQLEACRPAIGEAIPERLSDYDGVVVFGGPQSANDPHDYIRQEIDLIGRVLKRDMPLLGVCLGAQLMAVQLGARVGAHDEGLCERGYYPLRPTPVGETLLPWPSHVYHWHSEGFDLPAGAELLAQGDVFPNPGVPLWQAGLCAAIPSRSDAGNDVPLDHGGRRAAAPSRCAAGRRPFLRLDPV